MKELAILTATRGEQGLLVARLEAGVCRVWAGRRRWSGILAGLRVQLIETGLGAVNAAQAATALLEAARPDLVIQAGVGGAYPGSGLRVGELAVATAENYGDLGVRTPAGWQSGEFIGIPLAEPGGHPLYNRFDLDPRLVARAVALLVEGLGAPVRAGPFVTVQECTGTLPLAAERAGLFPGALCENMEGVAAAHVCRLYEAPFLELRAMSNLVEERRRETWDLAGAAARAQEATLCLIPEIAA
ncbi:MAG: futalosine hydrolase [Gemmatimonadota bacterium]